VQHVDVLHARLSAQFANEIVKKDANPGVAGFWVGSDSDRLAGVRAQGASASPADSALIVMPRLSHWP
jgi:hypothetical protein